MSRMLGLADSGVTQLLDGQIPMSAGEGRQGFDFCCAGRALGGSP